MRNFLATLIALAAAAYFGGKLFGPVDDLSTWQWIVFMVIGGVTVVGVMLLLGSATLSEPPREECGQEDRRAT
ncbi:hypothetical protein LF599_04660 [Pseudodesulfovibrio thermohalotolerans]|jgi:nucleoside recognition membrane protein YjiH|uniref:hypothetical protein n=1 Tax=Pseudodesulfovibrio thermohalotolerans TaxID=2880651 RepID=UPI0022B9DC5A|nr:hypothetical protein [Pseudodesulfovibrio thermohalotolerans]WFS63460.1 hypothetical protein LF599_04660 [Pseudodesulfovibrio thermohalotolerans]